MGLLTKKLALYLVLSFIYGATSIIAQDEVMHSEYSFRRFTTQDGLPGMTLEAVFKDSKGLLWQGTLKGGSSFDGFNFKPYALEEFGNVNLIEEINGEIRFIWGYRLYYPTTETLILLPDTLSINSYNSYSLPAGYYISDTKSGRKCLLKLENDEISELIDIPELQGLYNCKVYLDLQQNTLYIPNNRNRQVSMYNMQTKTSKTIDDVVIESFINHSQLGLLGLGKEGIYKIESNRAVLYIPLQFEMQNKIAKETRNGDIYIKDFYNIYKVSGKKTTHLHRSSTLIIWDMTLDDDENLWLATSRGLYNFFHFDFKNHYIPNHTIRSVTQDDSGTYWFAGDNEDVFSLKDGAFKQVKYPVNYNLQTISFNCTFSFNGITYFLIRGGILIHENNRFYWADLPHENQFYNNMVEYKDNLLVNEINTVFEITPHGKIIRTYTDKDLKITGFFGLAVDQDNRIIVGGNEGISIIDDGKVTVLKKQNYSEFDIVYVDKQNHIFSASNKYLFLIDGDSINIVHGFENDFIMAILPVDEENMIISTLKGFYIFNSKKYFENGQIHLLFYNHTNGMDAIEPTFGELFQDKNKGIWMVTSEKIVNFEPQKLIRQITAPSLTIQDASVSVDNVKWENINKNDDFAKNPFSYKNNNFRFTVLGLSYSATENVRYRYRLLGFQNEWSEPVKQREITFNNLPPNDYTFEIYADTGTDESKSEIQTFSFTIVPAFWQTTLFTVVSIIVLMFISACVTLYIQRRKNRVLFEKIRVEKELNELRISSIRLKAIPHFNANVLAAIEFYIANRTKEEAIHLLGIYSDFTVETLKEVDKASRTLSEELAYVKMYLDLEKIRFLDKFDFQINVNKEVDNSIQLPNMILHTYCENAIKHGLMPLDSGGSLTINVSQKGQTLSVSVEDNGVGRTFAESNPYRNSTKQGLSILSRQIEIYNRFNDEKIQQHVDDLMKGSKACGTCFTVEIPKNFVYIN